MDEELIASILQQVQDKFLTGQVKMMYLRACGEPIYTREICLPLFEDYCSNPYTAPACGRRITRTWCRGECIGQPCIFWGSKGVGTINLERSSNEERS